MTLFDQSGHLLRSPLTGKTKTKLGLGVHESKIPSNVRSRMACRHGGSEMISAWVRLKVQTSAKRMNRNRVREAFSRNRANRKRPKHSTNQTQHPHPNLKPFKVHLPGLPNLSQAIALTRIPSSESHPRLCVRAPCEAAPSAAWPASPTLQSRTVKKGRPRMMLTSLHHEICGSVTSVRTQVAFLSRLFGVFFAGQGQQPRRANQIRYFQKSMCMCALSQA